ncbi:M20 family metallopeptidase [Halocatena halophila]|uniref:M20 family metallopeptidase n=1 Tax=Halocatena halophila TaxID=2814576 RepID=UPI0038B260BC
MIVQPYNQAQPIRTVSLTALAQQLVAIPSHDDPNPVETVIVEQLAAQRGVEIERSDAGIIARRGGGGALALVCHHDVVAPDESQLDGEDYTTAIRDGRLYGRGSADMKGALAAAIRAFCDADGPCTLASFRGEEQGGLGVRRAIDDGFDPAFAVVCEGSTGYSQPGVTDIAVAHLGRRASTITTHGTAAHASEPTAGSNAIYRASTIVDRLRAVTPPAATILGSELQGTLAVTEIDGGDAWNVIPDRCAITVDERTVPGDRVPLEDCTSESWCSWSIDQDLPPFACTDDSFAERALERARAVQPKSPVLVTKPHATDAGWLAQEATTCLVCGPAEPGEAHTATESVSMEALERCYRIYLGLIERLSQMD